MKIAVTGYNGRLGSELVRLGCIPLPCDITRRKTIDVALRQVDPDVIIHCASMTNVDACEDRKTDALEVNAGGTENIKIAFPGKIYYISTDYVFDGKKGMYSEFDKPSSPTSLCWYGYTKLLGEELLGLNDTIIRTTILYGSQVKSDFVSNILVNLAVGNPFEVTRALFGTPTYVPHLAEAIMRLIELPHQPHILNIVGSVYLNRYDFALMIASVFGYEDRKNLIIPSLKIGKTKRPRKAGLKVNKAECMGLPIYSVFEGLKDAEANLKVWKQMRMNI